MGIRTRIKQFFVKQAARAVGLTFIPQWVRHAFMRITWSNLVNEGLKGNATVFACVSLLNRTFPEPELWAWTQDDDQEAKATGHAWRELMRRPNPDTGEAELMQYIITYASLSGNAYLWKQRGNNGEVVALWPFSDGDMEPIPGRNSAEGIVAYYVLDIGDGATGNPWNITRHDNGLGVAIPKSEIVHWKWMIDPSQPARGIGALEAAAKDIDTANEIRSLIYSLLKNDAKPPIVVNLAEGEEFSPEKADRLRAQWKKRFGGENRGLPAFLEFGMTVKELGFNFQELEMPELRDGPDVAICQGFGIQPAVVGALVGLKHSGIQANFEGAMEMLARYTLVPLWRSFASEVTQAMDGERGYDGVVMRFDLAQVEALRQNEDELWERARAAWRDSLITRAQALEMLGLPFGDGDHVYMVPLASTFEPATGGGQKALPGDKRIAFIPYGAKFIEEGGGQGKNGYHQRNGAYILERKADNSGAMVAFMVPSDAARFIALDTDDLPDDIEAVSADMLHLTLVFLGEAQGRMPPEELLKAVAVFAQGHAPLIGRLNGYGRFTNTHREGMDAVYATFDAQALPQFRQELTQVLAAVGVESPSEHGFVPHITLAYVPSDMEMPDITLPALEMVFDRITLAWGELMLEFNLTGEKRRLHGRNGHHHKMPDHFPYPSKAFPAGDGGAGRDAAPRALYERQQRAVRNLRRIREALRPKMESAIEDYFEEWAGAVMERLETQRELQAGFAGIDSSGRVTVATKQMTREEWAQLELLLYGQEDLMQLQRTMEGFYVEVVSESWPVLNAMIGSEAVFDMTDPAVTRALSLAGQQVQEISDSTRAQLRGLLQYANDNGWSIDDLVAGDDVKPGIQDFITETYRGRAETIARTELGNGQAMAAAQRFKGAGFERVIIFDNQFDNSDPVCTELDGTVQTVEWYEANRLQHPNCVRAAGPYFED